MPFISMIDTDTREEASRAAGKHDAKTYSGLLHFFQKKRHGKFKRRGDGARVCRGEGKFLKGLYLAEKRKLLKTLERRTNLKIDNHAGFLE